MYTYQLIEFTSSKRIEQIKTDKINLTDVLSEIYGNKLTVMFPDNGALKGCLSVFINNSQISSIKDIALNPNDEICIVTSISGG